MSIEEKKKILLTAKEILEFIEKNLISKEQEECYTYVKRKQLKKKLYGREIVIGR